MRKRSSMRKGKSKRLFRKTAGSHPVNRRVIVKRGGIRM